MSAVLKNMLDAICVGLAGGALMALVLDVIGREEALVKSFRKLHARIHVHGALRLPHFNAEFEKYEKD
jgi:hypothetical protein